MPPHFRLVKRKCVHALGLILIIFIIVQNSVIAQNVGPIKLTWLGGNPPLLSTEVSWDESWRRWLSSKATSDPPIKLLQLVGDQLPEDYPVFRNVTDIKSTDSDSINQYQNQKSELLYQDNFDHGIENWIVEMPGSSYSKVETKNGKLVIDVDHGATVWFKKKLSGNILIEYHRKVIVNNGHNDRLSDLNQFWMAIDPRQDNVFTRSGKFSEYDSLRLYYAGIGGNSNSTTRFRKYLGNGERKLLFDLQDKQHLLQPNKNYFIQLIVYNGTTKVFVDGEQYFSFTDDKPLTEGYFGFRTVKSHQEMDNFKVYRLK